MSTMILEILLTATVAKRARAVALGQDERSLLHPPGRLAQHIGGFFPIISRPPNSPSASLTPLQVRLCSLEAVVYGLAGPACFPSVRKLPRPCRSPPETPLRGSTQPAMKFVPLQSCTCLHDGPYSRSDLEMMSAMTVDFCQAVRPQLK